VTLIAFLPALLVGVVASQLDDRRVQRDLERYLEEIRRVGSSDNRRRNIAMRDLKEYLARLGSEDVPVVGELLETEALVGSRVALLRGLGSMDVADAADSIGRHLETLTGRPFDAQLRAELFGGYRALQDMTDPHAFDVLYQMLPRLPVPSRTLALTAMLGKPAVFSHLDPILVALSAKTPSLRAAAAIALNDTRSSASLKSRVRVAEALETHLPGEADPVVRQAIIVTLGSLRRPSSIPLLADVLGTDTLPRSREQAVEALIRIGGVDVGRVLEQHAERETHARVRVKARDAAIDILEGEG